MHSRSCAGWPQRVASLVLVGALAYLMVSAAHAASSVSLRQLHFSPDGRYILAQDDTEVTVLTAHPLAVLFRIPAQMTADAQFTPDSGEIVFVSSFARVERWGVASHTRLALTNLTLQRCGTELLSPNGRTLACVDSQGTLRLLDVGSGETLLRREKYVPESVGGEVPSEMGPLSGTQLTSRGWSSFKVRLDPSLARVAFSPDGSFVVVAPATSYQTEKEVNGPVLAWDTTGKGRVRLRGELGELRHGSSVDFGPETLSLQYFVFVAPDRVMISSMWWVRRRVVAARLVAFPSGHVVSKPKLPPGPLFRAADPRFVIVHPFAEYPLPPPTIEASPEGRVYSPPPTRAVPANQTRGAIAVEIATGHLITSETPALDVLGAYYVAEPSSGEVGLYERGKGLQATVVLHNK